jgi:ArsR family transcriptional regulator
MTDKSARSADETTEALLAGLRAVAEPTRLRILSLCAQAELSVTELVQALGQSQPRVSRHLKLMVEAGVLQRHQEGAFAYYRPAAGPEISGGITGSLVARLIDLIPTEGREADLDRERLERIREARTEKAADYFKQNADRWEDIRGLYADEAAIDARLAAAVAEVPGGSLLDIGTGTGRVLESVAPFVKAAVGVDHTRAMLDIARAKLDEPHFQHCQVRLADMYRLPFEADRFDTVTVNMVLRYAEEPERVLAEAARVLRPGGRLFLVDFAPHQMTSLRDEHAHRRLGFADAEIADMAQRAGLSVQPADRIEGGALTVCFWSGERPANHNRVALAS